MAPVPIYPSVSFFNTSASQTAVAKPKKSSANMANKKNKAVKLRATVKRISFSKPENL